MSAQRLKNISVAYAPLSDRLMLYRFGKDPRVALDKRDIEGEVMYAIVEKLLHGSPDGSVLRFKLHGQAYDLELRPVVESAQ